MAKGVYVGIGNVSRKLSAGYVGVDNISRRITKAYLGIGGVARPVWGNRELIRYGVLPILGTSRRSYASASVGGYAVFAGGEISGTLQSVVEAYDQNYTKRTVTALNAAMRKAQGVSMENYAIFGGGQNTYGTGLTTMTAYDANLTRTTPSALPNGQDSGTAVGIGEYALFGGGYSGGVKDTVFAYNRNLTRSTPSGMQEGRYRFGAAANHNYGIFFGGLLTVGTAKYSSKLADAYDRSLTRTRPTSMSTARSYNSALSTGSYALTVGGYQVNETLTAAVEGYSDNLTRVTAPDMNQNEKPPTGSLPEQGFGIAFYENGDVYSDELVHSNLPAPQYSGGANGALLNSRTILFFTHGHVECYLVK